MQLKIEAGHLTYLVVEANCFNCRRPVRYHLAATPLSDFPKMLKFFCKHSNCYAEWAEVVRLEVRGFTEEKPLTSAQRVWRFFFG